MMAGGRGGWLLLLLNCPAIRTSQGAVDVSLASIEPLPLPDPSNGKLNLWFRLGSADAAHQLRSLALLAGSAKARRTPALARRQAGHVSHHRVANGHLIPKRRPVNYVGGGPFQCKHKSKSGR